MGTLGTTCVSFTPLSDTAGFLPTTRGIDVQLTSYVPGKEIVGMAVSHGESETIARYLKHKDYSPSVYYIYSPCKEAWRSIDFVERQDYKFQNKSYALRGYNITDGSDAVGGLLLFKNPEFNLWAGTVLDINQTKRLGFRYSGPTTVQVAASIYGLLSMLFENKLPKGVLFPEDLDSEYILDKAKKWLGDVVIDYVDYRKDKKNLKII